MTNKYSNKSKSIERSVFEICDPNEHVVPLVFSSPHSGTMYPADFVEESRLTPLALRRSEDSFVDELFSAAPSFGAPLIKALFPRAYIDANREPFELDQKMFSDRLPSYVNTKSGRVAAGLGTIPRIISYGQDIYSRQLTFAEAKDRVNRFYWPYHNTLKNIIINTKQLFGYCILVDCHSMPSIGGPLDTDAGRGRSDFIIGDCFGSSCASHVADIIEKNINDFGYTVARNKPFAGGFTTRHYGKPNEGVNAVQIEINRALYMDEINIEKNSGFNQIASQMTEVIASLSKHVSVEQAAE